MVRPATPPITPPPVRADAPPTAAPPPRPATRPTGAPMARGVTPPPTARSAARPTAAPTRRSPDTIGDQRVTAREWFASGARRPYDPVAKTMVQTAAGTALPRAPYVFEKVVASGSVGAETPWLTLLPGYPDGSYGYAQVDRYLGPQPDPRLYLEYLGQGDSDKPTRLGLTSMERADLIEAQWRAHGVRRTMVVTFDYSSLALLELLRRQQERAAAAEAPVTTIDAVFIVNGGLFADAHSHPWDTTPMLGTPVGAMVTWLAQRVPGVLEQILRRAKLFSASYQPGDGELADLSDAIRRRGGAAFMHRAAGFVG